jgi:hypothetical protein
MDATRVDWVRCVTVFYLCQRRDLVNKYNETLVRIRYSFKLNDDGKADRSLRWLPAT